MPPTSEPGRSAPLTRRPPFSMGVFTDQDVRCVLQWGIDTYFRHYKLYQYAFTERRALNC